MFRRVLMVGALLALLAPIASAETVDEVLAKYIAARGGMDKIKAVKSVKVTGKMVMGGGQMEAPFVQMKRRPSDSRTEFVFQGLTGVQAYDGTGAVAWNIMPFMGKKDPEKMSADDAKALADDAPIAGALIGAKERGDKVEYLGTEDVDGTEAHKLKVTLKNGDVDYVFLDPDHFLEIRMVAQRYVRGTQSERTTDYGDYEEVNGVYFPFAMTSESKGGDGGKQQTTIEHAEANAPIEDSVFAFPAGKAH